MQNNQTKETLVFENGKYTLTYDRGVMKALRYGEQWRDLTGDNLVAAMFNEIQELREEMRLLKIGE